jgi:hypothetical protein
MVAAYSVLSICSAALSIFLLWPVDPLLALASAPVVSSIVVLLAAVLVALRGGRQSRNPRRSDTAHVFPTGEHDEAVV